MATFVFQALNHEGQQIKDEVDASSSEEAITKIREMGLFPTQVKEKGAKKKIGLGAQAKKKRGQMEELEKNAASGSKDAKKKLSKAKKNKHY